MAYVKSTYLSEDFISMQNVEKGKIMLSDELQKEILKFFLKTSIPRIAKQKRNNTKEKTLSQGEGQEIKC